MALEFTILDSAGNPGRVAPMCVEAHRAIQDAAREHGLSTITLFEDYYREIEIGLDVAPVLLRELVDLRERSPRCARATVDGLIEFVGAAIEEGSLIRVLPD